MNDENREPRIGDPVIYWGQELRDGQLVPAPFAAVIVGFDKTGKVHLNRHTPGAMDWIAGVSWSEGEKINHWSWPQDVADKIVFADRKPKAKAKNAA